MTDSGENISTQRCELGPTQPSSSHSPPLFDEEKCGWMCQQRAEYAQLSALTAPSRPQGHSWVRVLTLFLAMSIVLHG